MRIDRIETKYAQLIEALAVAESTGHGRIARDPDGCELCCNLMTLRRQVERKDRLLLAIVVKDRIRY